MQVDDAPGDEEVRETYNFAPGYNGVVYCAEPQNRSHHATREEGQEGNTGNPQEEAVPQEHETENPEHDDLGEEPKKTGYKLQSMKWGLVPFWTKRKPDYGSLMRTINCRDDSLIEDRGMWTSMKRKKRCVVVCQGFYEWLKKGPGGKEKVPHFVKRKDGKLMCFAGLWDRVHYEGINPDGLHCLFLGFAPAVWCLTDKSLALDSDEELCTYTIITTSSNSYLKFLHDRMPVVLDQGSDIMKTWLDPDRTTWSKELQSVLKPYEGELECYPVSKEVGKVGNDSPDFLIPVNSKENKKNIANFFANAKQKTRDDPTTTEAEKTKTSDTVPEQRITKDADENRATQDNEWSEDNAPVPVPGVKREHLSEGSDKAGDGQKRQKTLTSPQSHRPGQKAAKADEKKSSDGSQRITNFFQK